jgi:putative ABC transport system permease protein
VLVIVALPVAGLVAAVTLTESAAPTAEENATAAIGRADLSLHAPTPDGVARADDAALIDTLGELPPGTHIEVQRDSPGSLAVDGVSLPLTIDDGSLDPGALAAGIWELVDGGAPDSADAVAVSTALAERADLDVGDRIRVEPLGEVTVVGLFQRPEHLSRLGVIAAQGRLAGAPDATPELLIDLPDGVEPEVLADVAAIDGAWQGEQDPALVGETRDALTDQRFSRGQRFLFVIVGGLAAVEVALVAGAAFAVSVRRRQRELGLLAATGGSRAHVRRSVLLLGGSVGVAGALIGTALGLVATYALLPWTASLADRVVDGARLDAAWILGCALIGVVASVAGAWWPARSVAKLPVLTALSGRRPTPARASASLVRGVVLALAGVALCVVGSTLGESASYVFLAGAVAVVLGAGLTSPWLLEQLGRLARFLPAGPRLAVRDAARFRTRNGPIVTAAMAGLAATVTIGAVVGSLDAQAARDYVPSLPANVLAIEDGGVGGAGDVVARAIGERAFEVTVPAPAVVVAGSMETWPDEEAPGGVAVSFEYLSGAVLDTEAVERLLGERAVADLAAGRAVAIGPTAPGAVELRPYDAAGEPADPAATYEVAHHPLPDGLAPVWLLPEVLLPPTPEVLGSVETAVDAWHAQLVVTDGPVDDATYELAAREAARLGPNVAVSVERGYQSFYGGFARATLLVGGLAGLLIVSVAIALAAAESRSDLRTLTAVGAGARTRTSLAAGRALLLSGLGGLLAVPVGLLPAVSLLSTLTGRPPLVLPWGAIAVVVFVVPALATAGATLVSRREPAGLTRAA